MSGLAAQEVLLTRKPLLTMLNIILIRIGKRFFKAKKTPYSSLITPTLCSTELGRLPKVSTCANLMKMICYNNKDALMAGLICGGWDPYEGDEFAMRSNPLNLHDSGCINCNVFSRWPGV